MAAASARAFYDRLYVQPLVTAGKPPASHP
jgi:hypothetical protein